LLQYVSGSSRVPVGGFKNLQGLFLMMVDVVWLLMWFGWLDVG